MKRYERNDDQLDPVRRRLLGLLAENRSNLRTASLAIGRNPAYLHQFVHRGSPRVLAEGDREALAEHLGCSPNLLERPTRPGSFAVPLGYSAVPEIDVHASAGPGAWNDDPERHKDMWLFADPVIRHEFGANPENLRMISVDGDSMEPMLSNGDRLLIDVTRKVPAPPGVFAIWDGTALVAKRIEHVPHSDPPRVAIESLNPEYPSYERLAEEVRIAGRAVWVARRM